MWGAVGERLRMNVMFASSEELAATATWERSGEQFDHDHEFS